MNKRRRNLVNQAYDILDVDNNGIVNMDDIRQVYNASKSRDVMRAKSRDAKKKAEELVLREFLDNFDVGGVVDGMVTRKEFENYYTKISASIDSDDYFELMIRNSWHISGGQGQSANTANRRVLVRQEDGTEAIVEINSDLGINSGNKAGMMSRLKAQGVNAADIDLYGGYDDKKSASSMKAPPPRIANPTSSNARKSNTIDLTNSLLMSTYGAGVMGDQAGAPPPPTAKLVRPKSASVAGRGSSLNATAPASTATANAGVQYLINKIKSELKSRGTVGFLGLQRRFKIMDDNDSKSLDLNEFKKALKELKINLTDTELRMIFNNFDTDRSGQISYDEFIQGVRDPMSERRLKLVLLAFSKLDRDGSGVVDAVEIVNTYDVSKQREVITGSKTKEQALREFLATFDVGGVVDGMVTQDEFVNYYANVGASIDDDNYFELMIRNAWRLSGGEGQSANTANRRVLVRGTDGKEYVEEIQDELGLRANDKAGMMSRLKAQGVNAADIDLYGGFRDEDLVFGEDEDEDRMESGIDLKVLKVEAIKDIQSGNFKEAERKFLFLSQNVNPTNYKEMEIIKKTLQFVHDKVVSAERIKDQSSVIAKSYKVSSILKPLNRNFTAKLK